MNHHAIAAFVVNVFVIMDFMAMAVIYRWPFQNGRCIFLLSCPSEKRVQFSMLFVVGHCAFQLNLWCNPDVVLFISLHLFSLSFFSNICSAALHCIWSLVTWSHFIEDQQTELERMNAKCEKIGQYDNMQMSSEILICDLARKIATQSRAVSSESACWTLLVLHSCFVFFLS